MKNFLRAGEIVEVPAPAPGVTSGDFVVVGAFFGVAQVTAATGVLVPIVREGVFTLAKATGATWTNGDPLYWDATAKNWTKVSAGNAPLGVAAADALSGDTTGSVSIEALPEAVQGNPLQVPAGAGKKVAFGQATTVAAVDTIVTGLGVALAGVIVSFDDSPGDDPMLVSASIGDQVGAPAAGSFLLKTWKNTGGTDPTPLAATTFAKKVNWIAFTA